MENLPFERLEFLVPGVPRSAQGRGRSTSLERWKDRVRRSARTATGPQWAPLTTPLSVRVVYYHRRADALDVDNMLKPINHALKDGVVFTDDSLVTDLFGTHRRLDEPFFLDDVPPELAAAIATGEDFVHVVVMPAPDPREVLR